MSGEAPGSDVGAVLDRLTQLADAATPGPWRNEPDTAAGRVWVQRGRNRNTADCEPLFRLRGAEEYAQRAADAEFVAAARTAVPALVGALQAVLAIHTQSNHPSPLPKLCHGCNGWWPCPTVRAVTENLGGAL